LRLDIGLRNSEKTELDVAADGYNFWGLRYDSRAVISDQRCRFEQLYRDAIPMRSQLIEGLADRPTALRFETSD
jgi:hypothetical protein